MLIQFNKYVEVIRFIDPEKKRPDIVVHGPIVEVFHHSDDLEIAQRRIKCHMAEIDIRSDGIFRS